ncbi:hypothetical protein DFH08DRAFT_813443 [Mycena albidolilacea]|uniref:Uncharacterized protein n=1 Tax=Mycena albidolilacea TaxID=1033008 RepID=A0AAD6ZRU7_9AGAR|nr:hypothetical protein DFH08DRAFT_813443 [Mycena albidolilacea]
MHPNPLPVLRGRPAHQWAAMTAAATAAVAAAAAAAALQICCQQEFVPSELSHSVALTCCTCAVNALEARRTGACDQTTALPLARQRGAPSTYWLQHHCTQSAVAPRVLEAVERTHAAHIGATLRVRVAPLRIRGDTERKQPENDEVWVSEESHVAGGSVWGWMYVWKWRPRPDWSRYAGNACFYSTLGPMTVCMDPPVPFKTRT